MHKFTRVATLATILQYVEYSHALDTEDAFLLGLIAQAWMAGEKVTVGDAIVRIGGQILSRANAHRRLMRLATMDYVHLLESKTDRRVKHVVCGSSTKNLDNMLASVGISDTISALPKHFERTR